MSALIELNDLSKSYGSFQALHNVSLKIEEGITGLLGPNGAGKSTLIKVLLGLVKVNSGSGQILGSALGTQQQLIRSQIGYMPEDDCYMHGLSGIESMQVAAQLSRMASTEALRRGHEILDFCGMGQERYRNVETYSTGMRQKLRFGMAIVHDPRLLILDEPTSGLDPQERDAMLNRIRILHRQFGKAIILCTHILRDVQTVCDAVTILANGRVQLSDSLESLCTVREPSLTLQFTGDLEAMANQLTENGLRFEHQPARSLKVFGSLEEVSSIIWKCAESTGAVIRSIQPSRNSLEQIFLDAVREVKVAHS
ncbi:MAG: ABC transporter ATP-binding protein [Planctomycetaceae bacterium]